MCGRFFASRNAVGSGGRLEEKPPPSMPPLRRYFVIIATPRQSAVLLFAWPDEDPEERLVHVRNSSYNEPQSHNRDSRDAVRHAFLKVFSRISFCYKQIPNKSDLPVCTLRWDIMELYLLMFVYYYYNIVRCLSAECLIGSCSWTIVVVTKIPSTSVLYRVLPPSCKYFVEYTNTSYKIIRFEYIEWKKFKEIYFEMYVEQIVLCVWRVKFSLKINTTIVKYYYYAF